MNIIYLFIYYLYSEYQFNVDKNIKDIKKLK